MFLLLSFYLLHPLGPAFSSTLLHIQFQAEKKKPKDEKKAFSIFVENLAAFPIFRGLKANQEGRGKNCNKRQWNKTNIVQFQKLKLHLSNLI